MKATSHIRIIVISFLGNVLEFYDFTLYGVFAIKMSQVFFAQTDPLASLLISLYAIAIGFLMRPIGALLFGYIGDIYGRKTALVLSIIGIGFATILIGVTPSYNEIGILAPIIVCLSRFIQGICTGGEFNGTAIYCLETLGPKNRGFYSSFLTSGAGLGIFSAIVIGKYFDNLLPGWGWRIPFILGFFVAIVGLLLRYTLEETKEFKSKRSSLKPIPLIALIREYKIPCLKVFSLSFLFGSLCYGLSFFPNIFLMQYGALDNDYIIYANTTGVSAYIIFMPIMGYIYDRAGEQEFMLLMGVILLIFPYVAFCCFVSSSLQEVLAGAVLLGIATSMSGSIIHVVSQDLFPTLIRYRGISFSYSLGISLGGGLYLL